MAVKLNDIVGQVVNLQPIVNRLGNGPGRGPIANRPQVDNLPYFTGGGR